MIQAVFATLSEHGYVREPVGSYTTIEDGRRVIHRSAELSGFWLEVTGRVLSPDAITPVMPEDLIQRIDMQHDNESRRLRELLTSKMQEFARDDELQREAYAGRITLYEDELKPLDADLQAIRDFTRLELFPEIRDLRDKILAECPALFARFPILAACELTIDASESLEQLVDELREVERLAIKTDDSQEDAENDTEKTKNNSAVPIPKNEAVQGLIEELKREMKKPREEWRSQSKVARNFVTENGLRPFDDKRKREVENLLRQCRGDFRPLWDPGKKWGK